MGSYTKSRRAAPPPSIFCRDAKKEAVIPQNGTVIANDYFLDVDFVSLSARTPEGVPPLARGQRVAPTEPRANHFLGFVSLSTRTPCVDATVSAWPARGAWSAQYGPAKTVVEDPLTLGVFAVLS